VAITRVEVGAQVETVSAVKRHKHKWTALWDHFGPYGRQDVHRHVCFVEGCDAHLIGPGRDCSGKRSGHKVEAFPVSPSPEEPDDAA